MERWRRPPVVLDIEEDPSFVEVEPDGRIFGGTRMTLDAETTERMREGRICAKCLDPQEEAFPVNCRTCGFWMRGKQREWFEQHYRGIQIVGSRLNYGQELERLKEDRL